MHHELVFILNRMTPAYRRAHRAGFEFGAVRGFYNQERGEWFVDWHFYCVCGGREKAVFQLPDSAVRGGIRSRFLETHDNLVMIDCAGMLEEFGAFSAEHLRMDGYTEDEIKSIRVPWDGEAVMG